MAGAEGRWGRTLAVGLAAALAVGLVWLLLQTGRAPQGPVEVPLDAATCARCRMLVSDPAFAAQLHTPGGEVRFFDDPGCLLLHRAEKDPEAAGAWVHHLREDRWIPLGRARFVEVPRSPMGHGLGAVDADEAPEGLDAEEALARLRAGEATRRAGEPAP